MKKNKFSYLVPILALTLTNRQNALFSDIKVILQLGKTTVLENNWFKLHILMVQSWFICILLECHPFKPGYFLYLS